MMAASVADGVIAFMKAAFRFALPLPGFLAAGLFSLRAFLAAGFFRGWLLLPVWLLASSRGFFAAALAAGFLAAGFFAAGFLVAGSWRLDGFSQFQSIDNGAHMCGESCRCMS